MPFDHMPAVPITSVSTPPSLCKVKICGLSDEATITAALDCGAAYVGLVFYGPSPRNVELKVAAELAHVARRNKTGQENQARLVALFVDPDDEFLARVVDAISPDILQLHGSESPARAAQIAQQFKTPVMKAIKVKTALDASAALDYAAAGALILFDAKAEIKTQPRNQPPHDQGAAAPAGAAAIGTLPGGNGVAFDWSALDAVKSRVAFMLSGGLNPDNIAQAIAATGAGAVDVSSGVESAPGVKDIALIEQFCQQVRAANGSTDQSTL